MRNKVTGAITEGNWSEASWAAVDSPRVENYNAPSKAKVDAVQITPTTENVTEVIEYTQGTENIVESKAVTRTITYVDAADKTKEVADTVKQTATITRTNVRNKVTGVITEGNWSEANWDAVDSPRVKNYNAPNKAKVDAVQITPTTKDVTVIVEYTKLKPEPKPEPKPKPESQPEPRPYPGPTPIPKPAPAPQPDPSPAPNPVPVTPETPKQPVALVTPEQPAEPATLQYADGQNELPNTGTKDHADLATLGLLGALSGFGLVARKKREDEK
ncbi:MucBP domain protein [uncultured Streptococcus sp.]|nr:MucBP domain protein [uncultured Streptococcus sp.]